MEVSSFVNFQSYVFQSVIVIAAIGGSAWTSFKIGRKEGAEAMLDTLVKHKIVEINDTTDEILPVCEVCECK